MIKDIKQMTDLQKQIEEIEKYANCVAPQLAISSPRIEGIYAGKCIMAKEALSIIKELQHELSCAKHTHEESEEWIRQLQEELKQLKKRGEQSTIF